VDRESAIPGLPEHRERVLEMDRDHRQICKFEDGPGFTLVARQLNRIAEHAIRSLESIGGRESSDPSPIITAPPAVSALLESSVFQYQQLTTMRRRIRLCSTERFAPEALDHYSWRDLAGMLE
jgi:hypothetical protein